MTLFTSQCNDLGGGMSDHRFSSNRTSHHVVIVGQVDDNHLVLAVHLFTYAHKSFRLQGECLETNARRINA